MDPWTVRMDETLDFEAKVDLFPSGFTLVMYLYLGDDVVAESLQSVNQSKDNSPGLVLFYRGQITERRNNEFKFCLLTNLDIAISSKRLQYGFTRYGEGHPFVTELF